MQVTNNNENKLKIFIGLLLRNLFKNSKTVTNLKQSLSITTSKANRFDTRLLLATVNLAKQNSHLFIYKYFI